VIIFCGSGNQYGVRSEIEYRGVGMRLSEQFSTHRIIGDGNCYFRCLSYALTGNENAHHRDLRQHVVEFERQNRTSIEVHVWTDDTFEGHISRVSMVGTYARDTDILASAAMLSAAFNRDLQEYGKLYGFHEAELMQQRLKLLNISATNYLRHIYHLVNILQIDPSSDDYFKIQTGLYPFMHTWTRMINTDPHPKLHKVLILLMKNGSEYFLIVGVKFKVTQIKRYH